MDHVGTAGKKVRVEKNSNVYNRLSEAGKTKTAMVVARFEPGLKHSASDPFAVFKKVRQYGYGIATVSTAWEIQVVRDQRSENLLEGSDR